MLINLLKKYYSNPYIKKIVYILLLSLPVFLYFFKFSIIGRHGIFRGEDWDYFAQSYEAARQSILNYHQFPWWNPWMNGGQPLFANPQFGLVSIQMPLVLIFGTVVGLHYSVLIYFLIGFWGMYLLLKKIRPRALFLVACLSYVWVFSSFAAWHIGGGQLTFAAYLLSPWAILTIININRKLGWLWFGLMVSFLILTAMHYLTIEIIVICLFIGIFQIYSNSKRGVDNFLNIIRPYIISSLLILMICGARLVYGFQFMRQYPRLEPLYPAEPLNLFFASLTFRHPVNPAGLADSVNNAGVYGWTEYANYFGIITLALFFYLLIRRLYLIKSIKPKEWAIILSTLLAALLTLGAFSIYSPFSILHLFPVFAQMRVPSRFVCWFAFGVILFLIKLPKKPLTYILLIISIIDVALANYSIMGYPQKPYTQEASGQFVQYEFFQTSPDIGQNNIMNLQNLRLLRATQKNIGEVYAYEPILNVGEYYFYPGTDICGINKGCTFVKTKNADLVSWSPQRIVLKRTSFGPININMNPGKVWLVNGRSIFSNYRVLEQKKPFIINDPSNNIVITFSPAL